MLQATAACCAGTAQPLAPALAHLFWRETGGGASSHALASVEAASGGAWCRQVLACMTTAVCQGCSVAGQSELCASELSCTVFLALQLNVLLLIVPPLGEQRVTVQRLQCKGIFAAMRGSPHAVVWQHALLADPRREALRDFSPRLGPFLPFAWSYVMSYS